MSDSPAEGHGSKLSRKQELALAALLTEPTILAAAEKVNIGEATLRRWMKLPAFKAEFREARRGVFGQALAQLQSGSNKAVKTLLEVCEDADASPAARVAAARAVLELSQKWVETEEIAKRIEALEETLGGDGTDSGRGR